MVADIIFKEFAVKEKLEMRLNHFKNTAPKNSFTAVFVLYCIHEV